MTNYSLILVALFLIGLGLGDSPLVILSLCSLVLFFVISSSLAPFVFLFFFFFFSLLFVSFSVLSILPYVFMRFLFEYIFYYLSKKKISKKLCFKNQYRFLTLIKPQTMLNIFPCNYREKVIAFRFDE